MVHSLGARGHAHYGNGIELPVAATPYRPRACTLSFWFRALVSPTRSLLECLSRRGPLLQQRQQLRAPLHHAAHVALKLGAPGRDRDCGRNRWRVRTQLGLSTIGLELLA